MLDVFVCTLDLDEWWPSVVTLVVVKLPDFTNFPTDPKPGWGAFNQFAYPEFFLEVILSVCVLGLAE
jgi:hypothetical protein